MFIKVTNKAGTTMLVALNSIKSIHCVDDSSVNIVLFEEYKYFSTTTMEVQEPLSYFENKLTV